LKVESESSVLSFASTSGARRSGWKLCKIALIGRGPRGPGQFEERNFAILAGGGAAAIRASAVWANGTESLNRVPAANVSVSESATTSREKIPLKPGDTDGEFGGDRPPPESKLCSLGHPAEQCTIANPAVH
jgi:hypothetical protein